MNKRSFLSSEERVLLAAICSEEEVPLALVEELIEAEDAVFGMGRRHGIWERLDSLLRDYTEHDPTPSSKTEEE